jgi:hypothetical protein
MTSVTLVHPEETLTIPALQLLTKCTLWQTNPTLTTLPYRVQSSVSLSIFRDFLSALEGKSVQITNANLTKLQQLCEEFDFDEFTAKLSDDSPGRQI